MKGSVKVAARQYVLSSDAMREADRQAIEECGIPGLLLMEAAARCVADAIRENISSGEQVLILTGTGNNGGDGWAVARLLHLDGIPVRVFSMAPPAKLKGDAKTNAHFATQVGVESACLSDSDEGPLLEYLAAALADSDLVVDALLGTGSRLPLRSPYSEVVAMVTRWNVPVVAVDMPTGLDADTGQVDEICMKATTTITFGALKPGLLLEPGCAYAGKVEVADIGIPRSILADLKSNCWYLQPEELANILPPRSKIGHKGSFGHVLVVGGAPGLTGAPVMSAESSLRSGAGMVTVATLDTVHEVLEMKLTEAMTFPLPTVQHHIDPWAALAELESKWQRFDALALGPGLGQGPKVQEFVRGLFAELLRLGHRLPFVLDADGLNAVAPDLEIFAAPGLKESGVLTPHPGELARLLDVRTSDVLHDRVNSALQAAEKSQNVVVLKGAPSIVAHPQGQVVINSTGNVGLAVGGSGDVLTGIIGALLAEGLSPWQSAMMGCYTHGRAADLALEWVSARGMLPRDVIAEIPKAFQKLKTV